ncbi:C39 family peptidase [Sedimentibacter sp. MB31-C6]|uniref:C39 family peptidase n=1 Tax=Sedimentibacter sp. MB31-C6 TaxID=3109366 RepID=UPI002DDCDA07|nr:C39 family peptidase [Sedimentibacter sp. MB36-C1]WSI03945.1 C39 family peptidase [Sedimentibacter sp. MB36-C1]
MFKLKKVYSLILIIMLTLSANTLAFAANITSNSLDYIDINEDDYKEANEALIKKGNALTRLRSSKTLSLTHYYQDDDRWGDDIMETCGSTIASAGCCLTSFTMIQRYLGGSDDPGEVNEALGDYACPFYYYQAADEYDYTVQYFSSSTQTDSDAIDFIAGSIDEDNPVLVGMVHSSGETHFVAANGYNGDTIYIKDPSSYYDRSTLDEYLDNNWTVNRLCVYVD